MQLWCVSAIASSLALSLEVDASVVPPIFAETLRCPFKKVWLEHGPDRAAEILGVVPHRRLSSVFGSCSYTNPFSGTDTCMEFHGESWTDEKAKSVCDDPMMGQATGTLAKGSRCSLSSNFAGWCGTKTSDGDSMMTAMDGECKQSKDGCATWSKGDWVDGDKCKSSSTNPSPSPAGQSYHSTSSAEPQERCGIAPGPIGAAHQHGYSPGYSNNCSGTPAQGSPYMWPLKWTAHLESTHMEFQSDEPKYESKGQVWYMLDKNWKRSDTWYSNGTLRTVGQAPCREEDKVEESHGCAARTVNTTMLHRGSKMVFIEWSAEVGSDITNCTWLSMDVIGNIRPDWFMDDRGAATDVQYIGDSHVYHMGEPRLVKQWRKKDFANQYFTMSMQRLPGEDGVHWPLILNVPGEGFGDDFLQHWHGHHELTEADESAFLLDEKHERDGGTCMQLGGSGGGGPPTGQTEHVPSNLEIEKESWRKIVFTASPVWTAPAAAESKCERPGFLQVTAEVQAQYCYDPSTSLLRLTLNMDMPTPVWAAVGFRQTEECLMTPRGGADGEVVIAYPGTGKFTLSHGPLSPSMKRISDAAMQTFLASLKPLNSTEDFKAGLVNYQNGKLTLGFARKYGAKPAKAYFNFAMGLAPTMSYHDKRDCFEVANVPNCPMLTCGERDSVIV